MNSWAGAVEPSLLGSGLAGAGGIDWGAALSSPEQLAMESWAGAVDPAMLEAGWAGGMAPIVASDPSWVAGASDAAGSAGAAGSGGILSQIGSVLSNPLTGALGSLLAGGLGAAAGAKIGDKSLDAIREMESQQQQMADFVNNLPDLGKLAGDWQLNLDSLANLLANAPTLGNMSPLNLEFPQFNMPELPGLSLVMPQARGMQSGGHPLVELLERNRLLGKDQTDLTGGKAKKSRIGANTLFGMI